MSVQSKNEAPFATAYANHAWTTAPEDEGAGRANIIHVDLVESNIRTRVAFKDANFREAACSQIDFAIQRDWGWLFVEVDEMQHCCCKIEHEVLRMRAIHAYAQEHWRGKLHIVRYNP